MNKRTMAKGIFAAAALGLCFGAGAAFAGKNDDRVLRLSILAPLTTVDPQNTGNLQDFIFLRQVYEGLFNQNEKTGVYEPRIAESYTMSDDGTVYTFKIRKGVKFHNGDDLKLSDIVFSYKRALKLPKMRMHTAAIKDVRTDGDDFVVELKAPQASFINSCCRIWILSEREVTEQGDKFGTILNTAGTGPYYLTSLQHDVEWTCNSFKDYYLGEPAIKKLDYKPITQASAGLIAFEAGELDWYIAPIANWDDLKDNDAYNTELVPANHCSYITINPAKAPLNDENLRKAIAYAIDKDAMNMACYDGLAVNADFLVPAQNTGAPTKGLVYNYDLDKAREYLAKSAYPNGVDVGVISCSAGGYFEKMAQVLQDNLKEIGITSSIQRLDSATNMNNQRKQLYDIGTSGYAPYGDFVILYNYTHTSAVGSYRVKYADTPYDWKHMNELWDKSAAAKTPEERLAIDEEIVNWVANTATFLPVFYKVQPYVWVKDLVIPCNYPTDPRVYEWSWKD